MKTLFTSALLMMGSFSAFSQDTLFTRSGQMIPAKVYEINQTDIKYKKPSNPDGPLYSISKEDIAVIEYKNGSKDVFQTQGQSQNQSLAKPADDVYASASGAKSTTQVNNNYYGNPVPRPNVNVVLGMGVPGFGYGVPYWGGWGWYRPYYYRPYYYGGWYGWRGGCHRRWHR